LHLSHIPSLPFERGGGVDSAGFSFLNHVMVIVFVQSYPLDPLGSINSQRIAQGYSQCTFAAYRT
jgi:hypothetical protein